MESNNVANYVNVFACVCALFKCYKFTKGRTGSTLSRRRTKYVKCFRVETSCYRLVLQLKFIVTVEYYCTIKRKVILSIISKKIRAFASGICSEFKQIERRIVHQNALWSLVFSTTGP